jgi:hypothetical protein
MEGLDAWITGEGLCTYCGQRKCICLPDDDEEAELKRQQQEADAEWTDPRYEGE